LGLCCVILLVMDRSSTANDAADLRRGIDYVGVTVCFVVHDGNGKIMLHKRGKQARDENGRWDIGGGALEMHETFEQAVRRELKEEFLADALEVKYVHTYEGHREHKGEKTHWVAVMHAVKVDPSTVKNGEPHKIEEIGWFGLNDLPEPLHSMFPAAKPHIIKHGLIK